LQISEALADQDLTKCHPAIVSFSSYIRYRRLLSPTRQEQALTPKINISEIRLLTQRTAPDLLSVFALLAISKYHVCAGSIEVAELLVLPILASFEKQ
jgi:hypothetical protein